MSHAQSGRRRRHLQGLRAHPALARHPGLVAEPGRSQRLLGRRQPAASPIPRAGSSSRVPFSSPTRSGIDYFAFGLDWAIFDQQRDDTKPTWVIGVEGRVARRHPAARLQRRRPAATSCFDSSNPGGPAAQRDPGISRGMNSIIAQERVVAPLRLRRALQRLRLPGRLPHRRQRLRQVQPVAEPRRARRRCSGSFSMGIEVIPFEQREQFQRLVGRLPRQGHVPLAGPRLLRAVRRARLVERGLAAHAATPPSYTTNPAYPGRPASRRASPTRAFAHVLHAASPRCRPTAASRSRPRPPGRPASTSSSPRQRLHVRAAPPHHRGRPCNPNLDGGNPGSGGALLNPGSGPRPGRAQPRPPRHHRPAGPSLLASTTPPSSTCTSMGIVMF